MSDQGDLDDLWNSGRQRFRQLEEIECAEGIDQFAFITQDGLAAVFPGQGNHGHSVVPGVVKAVIPALRLDSQQGVVQFVCKGNRHAAVLDKGCR